MNTEKPKVHFTDNYLLVVSLTKDNAENQCLEITK